VITHNNNLPKYPIKFLNTHLMKSFFRKFQIIIFIILTFTISWYPGGSGFKTTDPSFTCLFVVAVVGGWKGIVEMLRRLVRWRVGFLWWSVALLSLPTMVIFPIGIHIFSGVANHHNRALKNCSDFLWQLAQA
jgi:hypothetical protein